MKRLVLLVITLLCLLVPASAFAAYNPLGNACKANPKASASTGCSANGADPISGPNGVLKKITLIIATLGGIAAVIVILVGGIQYVTSNGDSSKAASARSTIIGAAVGLIIIVSAASIITFVISKI